MLWSIIHKVVQALKNKCHFEQYLDREVFCPYYYEKVDERKFLLITLVYSDLKTNIRHECGSKLQGIIFMVEH